MHSNSKHQRRLALQVAIAVGLGSLAASVFSAPVESKDHQVWRELLHSNPAPRVGCFHATYPSTTWVKDECRRMPQRAVTPPRISSHVLAAMVGGKGDIVGDGDDYSIGVNGTMSQTIGSFPVVAGVTSEASVGVPAFGGGGILGPNEYTLQINTQFSQQSPLCTNVPYCYGWQQFIYSPDYEVQGSAAVFMQYWLLNYTYSQANCPDGWWSDGGYDCYTNSAYYMPAPDVPITQLGSETMSAATQAGGNDTATFTVGNTAYSITSPDSMLGLASWWNQSEFNIVGNAGGSEAVFNAGSFLMTKVAVKATSTAKPQCLANAGTTGETNNLNLGPCAAYSAPMPFIRFTQKN